MARRAKAARRDAEDRRDAIVAQRAVDEAGSASRQATRKFYDALDAHMRGQGDAAVVMQAARTMWAANQALRRLEIKHNLKPRKTPPSGRGSAGGPKSKAGSRPNLFGVRAVLPGSFEGGKRR